MRNLGSLSDVDAEFGSKGTGVLLRARGHPDAALSTALFQGVATEPVTTERFRTGRHSAPGGGVARRSLITGPAEFVSTKFRVP